MLPALITSTVILAIVILIQIRYTNWKRAASEVMNEGEIMDIPSGKIHYKLIGNGPVLFFMHGGPGGIDQDQSIKYLIEEGYSILIVSRPGYLQTPFQALSYEQQVDQYVELLDIYDKMRPIQSMTQRPRDIHFFPKGEIIMSNHICNKLKELFF